ncbi:MAG: riboflavin synthase [Candidatus Cloacimonas sp.]|jgi:riboflavin synthase
MFTGIIEATEKIISIQHFGRKKLISISKPAIFNDIEIGSSIACDGICLTIVKLDNRTFTVEIMNETIQKTTAKNWSINKLLNLERALTITSRLNGHFVQGHIDRELRLISHLIIEGTSYLRFEFPFREKELIVPQGSIALNGVSLTIAEIRTEYFSVAIIGHTLEHTNLNTIKPGEMVNVEFDIIGKYIIAQKDKIYELE